jgi:phospholipid/cholesterol/gamma-HCH transport system substrate-binding protein
METRANHILVGAATMILLAILAGFFIWLARFNDGEKKEYDIFFRQSVNGLAKGSGVLYSGVPIGEVKEIKLWAPDPQLVRVRISVAQDSQILMGTTATINSLNFTGVADIQLEGAIRKAPKISCPKVRARQACPAGKPVIPTKPGALGQLLNGAPLLLERLSTLTERLTRLTSDKNQDSIQKTLANVEVLSGKLATQTPNIDGVIADSRAALGQASATLSKFSGSADQINSLTNNANSMINDETKPAIAELKNTLAAATKSLAALETLMKSANPAIDTINNRTLPEYNQLARDLRELTTSLKSITDKLDQGGVSSLVGTPSLPDYDPKKSKGK